eukprot:scaffold12329_cov75-Cylindrotheca_fusiformis.AAC.1
MAGVAATSHRAQLISWSATVYRSTIGYRSQSRIPLNALAPRRAGSDVRTGKVYVCWYIESKKSNTVHLIS